MFLAVDIETTGLDYNKCGIISVGMAGDLLKEHLFCNPFPCAVEYEALQVNKIPISYLRHNKTNLVEADFHLCDLFNKNKIKHESIVPIGFSVGSFDMVFIKKYLPNFSRFFSRKVFDLNTMYMFKFKDNWENQKKKDKIELLKNRNLTEEALHNALTDATLAWDIFQKYYQN